MNNNVRALFYSLRDDENITVHRIDRVYDVDPALCELWEVKEPLLHHRPDVSQRCDDGLMCRRCQTVNAVHNDADVQG